MYLISFDPTTTDSNQFHVAVTTSPNILTWWHYLPATYLVTSNTGAYNLQNELVAAFPNSNILIIKVEPTDFGGWLPQDAWDWIRNNGR